MTRATLNLIVKRRNSASGFIPGDTFHTPHGKEEIAKPDKRLPVRYCAYPIIKCIQVEAAQEYSSLTDLVEHAPTFFPRTMENNYYWRTGPDSRAGIRNFLHYVFTSAGIKLRMNCPIFCTRFGPFESFSICSTIAEPTTTASAYARVCST